jgi:hypothetical protein
MKLTGCVKTDSILYQMKTPEKKPAGKKDLLSWLERLGKVAIVLVRLIREVVSMF